MGSFNRNLDRNAFAEDFPEPCPDGGGVYSTKRINLRDSMIGHIPSLDALPESDDEPDTEVAMDIVEFAWRHISQASETVRHSNFGHYHLAFNRIKGRDEWREEINLILQRHGVRLELNENGMVTRLGPLSAQTLIERPLTPSGDDTLDQLLAVAIGKFQDRRWEIRRESLEQLWDALERVKTVLDADKRTGVQALIERMATSEEDQRIIEPEFHALTEIGNRYQIRHHETDRQAVPESMVDYLFTRSFALIDLAVRALGGNETEVDIL